MIVSEALASKWEELGPFLRRAFWQPLHRMMAIFHILPLTAALIVFFTFATNGQLREIYLSYLEESERRRPLDRGDGGIYGGGGSACTAQRGPLRRPL